MKLLEEERTREERRQVTTLLTWLSAQHLQGICMAS